MKAWGGRFSGESDPLASEFGRSIQVDRELALDDLAASIAHVRGLWRARLLTPSELATLIGGLHALEEEVRPGRSPWDHDLEDVHLNLEMALVARVGTGGPEGPHRPVAQRPGDDRPAALAAASRRRAGRRRDRTSSARSSTSGGASATTVMPGYTHVQPAQPVLPGAPPAGLRGDAGA